MRIMLIIALLLASSLLLFSGCFYDVNKDLSSTPAATPTPTPTPSEEPEEISVEIRPGDEFEVLARYEVKNGQLELIEQPEVEDEDLRRWQDAKDYHQELWERFTTLFDYQDFDFVTEFVIASDGPGKIGAESEADFEDPTKWGLYIDPADFAIRNDGESNELLDQALIHEAGHLLTLNSTQLDLIIGYDHMCGDITARFAEQCEPNYFATEGCTYSASYLNKFYQEFWLDIIDEWQSIYGIKDIKEYQRRYESFYYARTDQFHSANAAFDPMEDVAYSWTEFIMNDKPDGDTIKEEKVLFFYQYPELLELRQKVRDNL
ncbi:hypothetical protein ACFL2B_03140 [Patescibacteria group bacterium]